MRFARLLLLASSWLAVASAPAQESKPEARPLVVRNRVELKLEGAETVLNAARAKAESLGVAASIAVVDSGGQLLAFARLDGGRPASAQTALTKAISAATFRMESGSFPPGKEPDMLLSLGIIHAASASGGKVTTLKGGVPIVVDGQIIGAVGVGGGAGEQDPEIARAGVQALLNRLGETK